jgi:hypothetical protein
MARSDLAGLGMLPAVAVIASVLSSSLFRPASPSQDAQAARTQHERQPGAIILRRVDREGGSVHLQVILLVLERPTGGVQRTALRNAIRFVTLWNRLTHAETDQVRILGPTFSGSAFRLICLGLLTAGHLLYLFPERSSALTLDLLAVTLAASVSMWILFGMERNAVISRLRKTTPGRVNFSWEFARRVAVYGILPLLAVISALFPEIGQPIFSWLGPLQKLVTF